ncbi:hypothetical protein ACTVM6_23355, partial [Serratia bockelmannii]|uniref:hypothetical protein n=1 Tax=Serratia bockelmannii TaxID=2703793 RepID=UPI003FA770D5
MSHYALHSLPLLRMPRQSWIGVHRSGRKEITTPHHSNFFTPRLSKIFVTLCAKTDGADPYKTDSVSLDINNGDRYRRADL